MNDDYRRDLGLLFKKILGELTARVDYMLAHKNKVGTAKLLAMGKEIIDLHKYMDTTYLEHEEPRQVVDPDMRKRMQRILAKMEAEDGE